MLVTATVLTRASLKVLAQPAAVVVTAADITRAHVDVPMAALVTVKSNSDGYMLEFPGDGEFMRRIMVAGIGSSVELSPGGGLVTAALPGGGMSNLVLMFRFVLSDTAQAGTYPWPLRLSVAALSDGHSLVRQTTVPRSTNVSCDAGMTCTSCTGRAAQRGLRAHC